MSMLSSGLGRGTGRADFFKPRVNPITNTRATGSLAPLPPLGLPPMAAGDWFRDLDAVRFDLPGRFAARFPEVPAGQAIGYTLGGPSGYEATFGLYEVPESMRDLYGEPQQMQQSLTGMSPDVRTWWRAQADAAAAANKRREEYFQAALGTLGGARERVETAQTAFEEDPARAALREGLMERIGPDYRLISERSESDIINQIAQAAARADAQRQASAAGRGVSTQVGAAGARDRAMDALAAAQGLRTGASIDVANAEARQRAEGTLGQFTFREEQLRQGLLGQLTAIDDEIARIEAGEMPQMADPLAFVQLDFGIEQFRELMDRSDEASAAAVEAEQFGWEDLAMMGLSTVGQGWFG